MTQACRIPVLAAFLLAACATLLRAEPPQVVHEWTFNQEGQMLGWVAGGHIKVARVENGALRGTAVDWDPILMGPVFEIRATPGQFVEVRIRCERTGMAELFWTETLEGKFGGFSQEKYASFSVVGGEGFRNYRVYPFWHSKGKIVRLRLDVPPDGEFAIEAIRILDAGTSPSTETAWQGKAALGQWEAMQQTGAVDVSMGKLQFEAEGNRPILLSPLLDVEGKKNPIVAVRMAVSAGSLGRIYAVNRNQVGWEDLTFPLRPDGRMHTYNIDMGGLRRWAGMVLCVAVQPTDTPGAKVAIESIEIADDLRGPAELEIDYFGRAEGVNRVGKPARVICTVRNAGGALAEGATARLEVPEGVAVVGSSSQTFSPISLYLPQSVEWRIQADRPGAMPLAVRVEMAGHKTITSESTIEFTPVPQVAHTGYVPEPEPVRSKIDVGAFYFPGWNSTSRWAPILDFPMRRPVLGWYDEANPECADWQIKWAVEHGINFFMVDWYWSQGNRHLEHWLHDAYANAKYKKDLKWAIMWANHNRAGSHSLEDWRQVTQFWLDHYLKTDEYYRIDGRPAVFIWAPQNIRNDLGGSDKTKELYDLSQEMAREAGLPGIYFVAMSSHSNAGNCRELKSEGYEAFTSYHGFQLAEQELGTKYFSFEEVVRTSPQVWKDCDERASGLDYFPIVDTGWSSEPWHRSSARVIHGRTPERLERLCRAAREYAEQTGKKIVCLGPWNEWGEGSYIEPYAEYGFNDLDAVRRAFCPPGNYPPNVIPADVGLGPYDMSFSAEKTSWEFDCEEDLKAWTPNGAVRVELADGVLKGHTTGADPILSGPSVRIDTSQIHKLAIRMRSSRATAAQLYWGTTMLRPSETTSVRFQVPGDNQWHEYTFDLRDSSAWRGVAVSLRLDPSWHSDTDFAVDYLRLE